MRGWLPLFLIGTMGTLGCGENSPDTPEGPPTLRIGGSEAITGQLVPALANTHVASRGTIRFEIGGGGSGEGIRGLLAGELDIAASTREANPNEVEQATENGYALDASTRHIVGVDVVAVSVHRDNYTDSLTYDQLIGIFCTHEIDDWSFLGLEASPIRAIAQQTNTGSRTLFEDFFCGPKGVHGQVEVLSTADVTIALRDDPSAISFASLSEGAGKPLGLRPDPNGPAVRPTQQNIIRGAYPLYHDLYLSTAGAPKGIAKEFIDYALSPAGQEVVDEKRFVPLFLRPERLDSARPLRETIHFEPGVTIPNQRSAARLQLLVSELQERAGEYRHIVLEGYTDNREEDEVGLSQARAEAVRGLLTKNLPGMYFEIIPRGARSPIAPNDTPYGRQRNRRVQIYLAAEETADEDTVRQEQNTD
ncbi:MAG: OmpA family protein [Rhodobacterales bacterium]|nr:OmpA family protein [Rhodobacterales bacterium]